ncbi:protein FAR1-RELATED SEQUENCE 6 isoform X2 [Spinacia oleracea]|nr:protein FAR1-RELATED SEQUENCE 6-like isoform X2 [Spinacia oleracea]
MGAPDSATIDNPCSSATLQSVTDPVLVNSGEENSVEIENEKIMGNESADERICNLFNVDLDSTTVDFEAAGIEEVEEMESSTLNGDMDNDICQSSAKTYNGADPIEVNDLLKNLDIPLETPSAGMIFLSEDDVERYYKAYGKQQGFLIVRGGNGYQWKNKGVKRSATWTCDCAGLPRVRERGKSTTQQALTSAPLVKSKKCQCPAKLYAVVCSDGNWLVKHVVLEHMNHTLSPNKFGSTPDCRKLPSNDVKQKLLTDIEGGISHAQPLAFLLPKRNDMDQKPFGRVINLEAVDVSEGEKMMPSLLNKEVDEDICKTSAKACNVRDTLEVDDLLKNLNNTMLEPPRVGMGFSSDEEIEKYYKAFAKQQGFQAVRHGTGYHWKNKGVKRAATWTCDCAGLPRIQDRRKIKIQPTCDSDVRKLTNAPLIKSKKCQCPAKLYAVVCADGNWMVKHVVLEHKNHTLNSSKSSCISDRSKITYQVKQKLLDDVEAGLSPERTLVPLIPQRNVMDQIPEEDLWNNIDSERRLNFMNGDALALQQFLLRMYQDKQDFFHAYRLDCNGYLKDVMWVDARSREAYYEFGDVVYFDTTCLTNGYDLPLASFVGVNHHGQSILLGCVLVSREDLETFKWVLRTWLRCMGDRAPGGIVTQQCIPLKEALVEVMPDTIHRWCIGHILCQVPHKFERMFHYEEYHQKLKEIVWDSLTPEEFENGWGELMTEFELEGNEWLVGLYEEREMWVPAYLNHMFWAGMMTKSRAESMNKYFDGYIEKKTGICEFLENYFSAVEKWVRDEMEEDATCTRNMRSPVTDFAVELFFQKVYTDAKFVEVQRECQRVLYCNAMEQKQLSETTMEHVIQDRVWTEIFPNKGKDVPSERKNLHRVTFQTDTYEVRCDCKLFECHGILCRHIIRVLDLYSVQKVPEKYVLRRWCKDVRRKYSNIQVAHRDPLNSAQMIRYDKMQLEFDVVANLAMKSDDLCASVMQGIHELKRKVEEADGQRLSRCNTTVVSVDHIGNDNESIVTTKRKEMITKYPPRRAKICRSSEIVEMPLAEMSVQNKRARPEQTLSQV